MNLPGDDEDVAGPLPTNTPRTRRQFIDQIQGRRATVLDEGGQPSQVPLSSLPGGIKEGQWMRGDRAIPTPSDMQRPAAPPAGDINLDQPPQPQGATPTAPGARFTATHKTLGTFTFDSNELEQLAKDAKSRHMHDLEPLIKIKGLEEYAPALAAAASTPGATTEDMFKLVQLSMRDKEQRDKLSGYNLTADQQYDLRSQMAKAAMVKARNTGGGGGGADFNKAQAVLQQGGTMEEALAASGATEGKDVRTVGSMDDRIEKLKARELRDEAGHDYGVTNRGVDAAAVGKQIGGADNTVAALKLYKQRLAEAGDAALIPGGQSPANPFVSDKQREALRGANEAYQAAISYLRVAEMQPQAAFALKMDQQGVGHAGTGPLDRLTGNFLTPQEADQIIARVEETKRSLIARSVRRESPVGHSQPEPAANPLTRAAKAKTEKGKKRSLDDIAAEHGL
jgi:hypothetical protein